MIKTSLIISYEQFVSFWRRRHFEKFGSGHLISNDVHVDYEAFCKVIDSIRTSDIRKAFSRQFLYRLNYLFLGELQKISYHRGVNTTEVAVFYRKELIVRVANESMFSLMLIMKDFLVDQNGGSEKGLGLPRWLKLSDFNGFEYNIRSIINDEKMIKNIMFLPRSNGDSSTQEAALKASKLRNTKQCLEHCKENSPGEWLSYFNSEESFQKSVDRHLKASINYFSVHHTYGLVRLHEAESVMHKKHRINRRACEQFLRYLAYLSSMSAKLNRPIEISSALEARYFNSGYKIMREAAKDLGWLICVDDTYCVGVRCMTFQPRVCMNKKVKAESEPRINEVESKILKDLIKYNRNDVIEYYGEDAVSGVEDRRKYADAIRQIKSLSQQVRSSFGSFLWQYSDCGKDIATSQWFNSDVRRIWIYKKKRLEKIIEDHRLKYSRPRQNYRTTVALRSA